MRKLILASALTALVLATGCCSHQSAIKVLDRAIATNGGHIVDGSLPQEARDIAEDNYDVHWKVKADLDSDVALPADVVARQKAREEAAAAANGGE